MKVGQDLIDDINRAQPEAGSLSFWWIGQMSFIVKTGGKVLYFDPYLSPRASRTIQPMLDPLTITHADYVFGTHDHLDHIDPLAMGGIAQASPQARFFCSRVASSKVLSFGIPQERVTGLDEGMIFEENGVRITPLAAQHEFFDRDPVLGYPYLMFVVEIGGVAILHTGDTLRYDGMLAKLSRWKFDVIFLPINGRDAVRYARHTLGNMTYQEAVDMAGELRPRLVVPGHYEMFAHNSQDPKAFSDYLEVKFPGVSYWIGDHGEEIHL